jgi:hypothetical protein
MTPVIGGNTIHASAMPQEYHTATGRAEWLGGGVVVGGDRLVGVGLVGDFHGVWPLLNGRYDTAETAVLLVSVGSCDREIVV